VKGCSAQQASGGLDCAAGETLRNSAVHLVEYYACDAFFFKTITIDENICTANTGHMHVSPRSTCDHKNCHK